MSNLSMPDGALLDRLAADAVAVKPLGPGHFSALLAIAALVSGALVTGAGGLRSDLADVIGTLAFSWKAMATLAIGATAALLLYRSGRPGAATRHWLGATWLVAAIVLGGPLAYSLLSMSGDVFMAQLHPESAAACAAFTVMAAIPVWIAALMWLARTAPTNLAQASWAAGLASGGLGAALFVLHCPYDQIPYVSVWYGLSIFGIAGLTRLVLPRLIRW
jgi:hypothetical protein